LWWDADPDAHEWDSEASIAQAWVCAAEGATSQAISIIHDAAKTGAPTRSVRVGSLAFADGDTVR
jgi:hypothetical protein